MFVREIVAGVLAEAEAQQMPQPFPMLLRQNGLCRAEEIVIHAGLQRVGIGRQCRLVFQVVLPGKIEQRVAMVKEGRRRGDLIRVAVDQETEVAVKEEAQGALPRPKESSLPSPTYPSARQTEAKQYHNAAVRKPCFPPVCFVAVYHRKP